MYYYFETVFLFMGVMPAGSIVSAYTLITTGERGMKNVCGCILVFNFSQQFGPMSNVQFLYNSYRL